MFRFETIVGIVIALSSFNAFGAEDSGRRCPDQLSALREDEKELKDFNKRTSRGTDAEKKALEDAIKVSKERYDKCVADVNNTKDDECTKQKTKDETAEKFKKVLKEFHTACGGAGMSISSQNNNIGCSEGLRKCRVCVSKTGASEDPELCSSSGSSDDDDSDSKSSGEDLKINFSKLKRQAEYCPHLGAKAQKDYEKKYDDSRKDVKEMEKKLPEARKKYTEAINKGEDDAAQAGDKMVKAQQALDQDLAEAEEKYRQAKKDISAQIVQLQQQIAQVDDQTRQYVLAKTDAEVQYNEAIRQIELNCYQTASTGVAKLQAERLSRPFNRGNMQTMMKQVGMTDRQSWQRKANELYRRCLAADPTKASKASAKAAEDSALRKADAGLQKVNEQRLSLVQQQMNLKNGVCNPNANAGVDLTGQAPEQSETCQAAQKALTDAQRAHRKYNSEANKAASDEMKAKRKADNEAGTAQMEAADLNRQIQDEKTRMKNLRRAAEIADKASDDAPDPKAYEKANEKFDELTDVGLKYVACMKTECDIDDNCKKMKNYFNSKGPQVTAPTASSRVGTDHLNPSSGRERTDADKPDAGAER